MRLASSRVGSPRHARFHVDRCAASARLPYHLGIPPPSSCGAVGAVCAGAETVRTSRLVRLGHVALDGTKIKANASKHKAMGYERMKKREAELQAEVDGWLKAAEAADAAEDKAFGADKRGDEMPDWVADKQARLAKIREAKAELEAEAKAKAVAEQAAREKNDDKPRPGRKAAPPSDAPELKAQRNFTDPESRIQPMRSGAVIAGYN